MSSRLVAARCRARRSAKRRAIGRGGVRGVYMQFCAESITERDSRVAGVHTGISDSTASKNSSSESAPTSSLISASSTLPLASPTSGNVELTAWSPSSPCSVLHAVTATIHGNEQQSHAHSRVGWGHRCRGPTGTEEGEVRLFARALRFGLQQEDVEEICLNVCGWNGHDHSRNVLFDPLEKDFDLGLRFCCSQECRCARQLGGTPELLADLLRQCSTARLGR